jgi:hypothetical protein
MNAILKQKKIFIRRQFELTDKSLKIKITKPFNDVLENEISLEEISRTIIRRKFPNIVPFLIAVAMLVGVIITIISHFFDRNGSNIFDIGFYVVAFTISLFINYFAYQNNISIILNHGGLIVFDYAKANQIEADEFLILLRDRQKQFLLNKYASLNSGLSNEQLNSNLYLLWERNIIDDIELDKLRKELIPLTASPSPIGFLPNKPSN